MTNPYTTLGVSESASDDEIKKAYREKVVEYSSHEYQSGPSADTAAKLLDEYNAAYDEIMSRRRTGVSANAQSDGGYAGSDSGYAGSDSGYAGSDSRFADIRTLIRNGDLDGAEQKLLSFPSSGRNAEWNFLMCCVMREKGWLDEACSYASNAHSLDPQNAEYKMVYDQLMSGLNGGGNRASYTGGGYGGAGRASNGPTYANTQGSGCCGGGDDCGHLCQCLCLYSMCQSCCCNGN
ncbi:MAG: DnaJ domain-containing protein [Ruminococcaceae bacterium]|nr:DnaJ domain-containing protein [Oscillospiraceae bacterium]